MTVPAIRNLLGREPGHGLRTASLLLSMSTSVTYTNPAVLEFSSSWVGNGALASFSVVSYR